jgi:hypothetical protein
MSSPPVHVLTAAIARTLGTHAARPRSAKADYSLGAHSDFPAPPIIFSRRHSNFTLKSCGSWRRAGFASSKAFESGAIIPDAHRAFSIGRGEPEVVE